MKLIIEDDEGRRTGVPLVGDELTITAPIQVDSHDAPTEQDASTEVVKVESVAEAVEAPPRELAEGARPRLLIASGPLAGKEFTLARTPVAIGRTGENDLAIDDPSVSRFHCKLFLEGDTWKLLDNRSAQGVKVNGEQRAACALKFGDTVAIGQV